MRTYRIVDDHGPVEHADSRTFSLREILSQTDFTDDEIVAVCKLEPGQTTDLREIDGSILCKIRRET